MSCDVKSCVFVLNKSMFLTLNDCFRLKYDSSIHNIAFSTEKAVSSETGEKYAQTQHHLQAKKVQNSFK